jgi:ABC-type Fe3+ transport system permease subunit
MTPYQTAILGVGSILIIEIIIGFILAWLTERNKGKND